MIAMSGMALALLGAALLYLASPNQRATSRGLPGKPLALVGCAFLAVSLTVLLQWAGPATAVFIWMTLAMFVWTVLPPLAAWFCQPKRQPK